VIVFRASLVVGLTAAVLAGAVAGCGGSSGSSDATKVKQTVTTAFTDLANGDGQGFCSLATPAGQQSLAKALPGSTCAKVVTLVSQHLSAQQKQALRHTTVKTVTVKNSDITSSSGSLKGILGASSAPTTLAKQSDGSWKLAG